MFIVVDKETGQTYAVYGTNGYYFLIYDHVNDVWTYKGMDSCRPCKPEEDNR